MRCQNTSARKEGFTVYTLCMVLKDIALGKEVSLYGSLIFGSAEPRFSSVQYAYR